ncbi:hypothetical protein [Caballeronia sp. BCC1704]|uniref:hypothetical protein n=1 Tax=Caballeronia sp. BCC1704 TaxID=2676300 RepID=UPI00158BA760|nr:hypothetical protein [Caballeronia sp. BCC1704]
MAEIEKVEVWPMVFEGTEADGRVMRQTEGPSADTQFWAIYKRDSEGFSSWLADHDTKEAAELEAKEQATALRVPVAPYPWVKASSAPQTPLRGASTAAPRPMDHEAIEQAENKLKKLCAARGIRVEFDRQSFSPAAIETGIDNGERVSRVRLYKLNKAKEQRTLFERSSPADGAEKLLKEAEEEAKRYPLTKEAAERREAAKKVVHAARTGNPAGLPLLHQAALDLLLAMREDLREIFGRRKAEPVAVPGEVAATSSSPARRPRVGPR